VPATLRHIPLLLARMRDRTVALVFLAQIERRHQSTAFVRSDGSLKSVSAGQEQ